MRLDNQQFNFNLTKTGENIIRCSQVDEAFFNVFNITLNENAAFIKSAERYVDGCPIIKVDVEYGSKIYKDIEFKVVVESNAPSQVFINEHALLHGIAIEFESEALLHEQAAEVDDLIEQEEIVEDVDLENQHNWTALQEESKANKENKIVEFLQQVEQQLLERIDESIDDARQSIAASALGIQNKAENIINQKINDGAEKFADLFEQWKQTAEIKINKHTIDVLRKACKRLEDQFETVVQEQEHSTFTHLSEKIFAANVEAKNALQGELTSKITQLSESLQAVIKDADENLKLHVEQQLKEFNENVVTENVKNFDDGIAAFFAKQTTWLQDVSKQQIDQIKESVDDLKQQLKDHAQQTLEEAADKIATKQIKSVRECVEEVFAEQVHALKDNAPDEGIISEARASQANVFKDALGAIKTEMSNEVKSHVANLQTDLYKKFAIYAQSYAGGGTVAVQYADGGTMNGTLNVATGQILSGGVDLADIFSSGGGGYQTLTFNTSSGDLGITPFGNTVNVSTMSAFNAEMLTFTLRDVAPVHVDGRLYYDSAERTLVFMDGDPVLKYPINKMLWIIGVNKTGSEIPKGTVVYLSGVQGNRGKMWPALATSDLRSADTIGITMGSTAINQEGYIMTMGELEGIDTRAYPEGTTLYLSSTAAGAITNIKPQAPNHLVKVGFSLNSTVNGKIYVEIDNGYELDELHNVRITDVQDGQTLVYNSASAIWINANNNASGNYLPLSGGTVTGNVTVQGTLTTSLLEATSANITYIDIKQYELSGFDVTGSVAISGNLTVAGTVSSSSAIYFSGGNTNQLVDTLYINRDSAQTSLTNFINTEWYNGIVKKSGTINLTANGRIYMLATGDGSNASHYLEINPKPISNFEKTSIADFGIIDSYSLTDFNSCKYIIEVRDTVLNKVHYSEINTIGDGAEAASSEYGILFTSTGPLVEYGTITNGLAVSLTAHSLQGNATDKVFKCLRTNLFAAG
jgi:hypothetical protein